MRLLSRAEELVLLAVWKLRDDASSIPIREHLTAKTGKEWSFGSVFAPLERLEKNGLLRSRLAGPTNIRGGRSKRIYRLTSFGREALAEMSRIQTAMWEDAPILDGEAEEA
jgi:PadR family transcriptional regulator PadR